MYDCDFQKKLSKYLHYKPHERMTNFDIWTCYFNPVQGDVSDSTLNPWSGQFDTTSEMNKLSKKFTQILRLGILEITRFCCTLS